MWPTSRPAQIAFGASIAYCVLWGLYLLFPEAKAVLLATPYLGSFIEISTGLYLAILIGFGALWLLVRG